MYLINYSYFYIGHKMVDTNIQIDEFSLINYKDKAGVYFIQCCESPPTIKIG